ncbi:uncharacterized protein MELLADRAFT_114944 [Melampsora larici-populina 98AG31]|uniref:Exonuclease domain-containing protein n=1 Tax=Melampsora larici-populina (strain 98AG31 / pathotype 3-4-7) TaxID=747676 RepID=F4R4M3_MELLP|nr:uncharacterized protein MELLADRAFT_114944 [Melampsora larici-populina 98AG31]EGG12832.1 hypothetical protein MELLADRAFT_114944 [Melampsora larici-populina 98AG31]
MLTMDRLCTSFAHVQLRDPNTNRSPEIQTSPPITSSNSNQRFHHSSNHYFRRSPTKPRGQEFHSFLCLDVESTCINSNQRHLDNPHNLNEYQLAWMYPNEIIEWPVILMQWRHCSGRWELYEVDRYRSFVKPTWRPEISEFCTQLTGITQQDTDNAPTLPAMLKDFQINFIERHQLFTVHNRSVWVTDGPWDLRDHWIKSIFLSKLKRYQIPSYLQSPIHMIDMRYLLQAFIPKVYCIRPPTSLSLNESLKIFGLEFEGQEHSGIDDAANLSRLLSKLTQFDCRSNEMPFKWIFRANRTLNIEPKRYFWMGKGQQCTWIAP